MFLSMLKVEHTKLYRRALLWIELATIAAVIMLLFGAYLVARLTGLFPNDSMDPMMTWPQSLRFSLSFVSGQAFGALIVMLLASVVIAQEYQWGTNALWLRQGLSRAALLGARFVTLLGAVIAIALTALLTSGMVSAVFTLILQGGLDVSQVDWVQVGLSVVRTVYSLLPYLALSFLVAVWTRSTAWSLGVGTAYALVIEGPLTQILMHLLGGWPAKIAVWLPGPMAYSLVDMNSSIAVNGAALTGGPQYLPPEIAAVGIAVYTLIFLGAAFRIFVRQDIGRT